VALKEYKPEKIYYTMGEVTEMFDVNASLIRFWEQRFDVLKPEKNKKGNRLFTPADIKNLEIIYHLVKERGMTLAGAEKYLKANKKELERDTEIVRSLQTIRSLLAEIREELKEPVEGTRVIVATDPEPEEVLPPRAFFEPEPDPKPVFEPEPEPEEEGEPFDLGVSEPFTAQPLFEVEEVPESTVGQEEEKPAAEIQSPVDVQALDTQQSLF
jgi:DNA-binding transcriptional MerR regulator